VIHQLIDRTRFSTRADAEREVFSRIEGFYNPWRRHSANGQISPAEYGRRHTRPTQDILGELARTA
jgi:putative transposase